MSSKMGPLKFIPLLKRIRWGGRRLGDVLGKNIGAEADYAESWEICDHGGDQSLVAAGEFNGTLTAYIHNFDTLKQSGAPVDWVALPPSFANLHPVALNVKAPHPNLGLSLAASTKPAGWSARIRPWKPFSAKRARTSGTRSPCRKLPP